MKEEDKEYWQQLNKAYIESSSQFDKQVLFFASGALGLSFAFIKDIVVILLSILSHYTSLKAINNKIHNLNSEEDKLSKRLNAFTKCFNILMIVFLAFGLILLTVFVAINI